MKITEMPKNLIDELEDIMAQEIQKEIDNGILIDMMVLGGWVKVELPPFESRHHSIDILTWAEENCQGEFKEFAQYGRIFVFKNAKDATAFALKWL